jgi:hypothetical protein
MSAPHKKRLLLSFENLSKGHLEHEDGTYDGDVNERADGTRLAHGSGTRTFSDGSVFVGTFRDGVPVNGDMTYGTDGSKFMGAVNERFELHCDGVTTGHGKAIFTEDDGTAVFEGTFENGNPVRGTMTSEEGSIQTGAFNDHFELHGDGVENSPDGSTEIARFECNQPIGWVVKLTSDRSKCVTGYYGRGECAGQLSSALTVRDVSGEQYNIHPPDTFQDGERHECDNPIEAAAITKLRFHNQRFEAWVFSKNEWVAHDRADITGVPDALFAEVQRRGSNPVAMPCGHADNINASVGANDRHSQLIAVPLTVPFRAHGENDHYCVMNSVLNAVHFAGCDVSALHTLQHLVDTDRAKPAAHRQLNTMHLQHVLGLIRGHRLRRYIDVRKVQFHKTASGCCDGLATVLHRHHAGDVFVACLESADKSTRHAVTIVANTVIDSCEPRGLQLNRETLNYCCGGVCGQVTMLRRFQVTMATSTKRKYHERGP